MNFSAPALVSIFRLQSRRLIPALSLLVAACGNQPAKLVDGSKPDDVSASANSVNVASESSDATNRKNMNGPFGIEIGAAVDTLGQTTKLDKPGFYIVDAPPKPHPAFERVIVIAYPETGVCMIRGIGHDIPNDGAGVQTRSAVDEIAEALKLKYGSGRKIDTCFGSGSCNSEYWMMYMENGERYYGYEFRGGSDSMKTAKISGIDVAAGVSDLRTGYTVVEYTGENKSACQAAAKRGSADAL